MNIFKRLQGKAYKRSYSQCGEDLIVAYLLYDLLKLFKPTYLDIGAHHPFILSNTFLFYERGCRGVCLEPDPNLFTYFQRERKEDVCLNVGVGTGVKDKADFYRLSSSTLNTFSESHALEYTRSGNQQVVQVIEIPLVSVNEVVGQYFDPHPNFVSLDTEGMDLDILETFDFKQHRPEIFCVETLTYTEDKTERKLTEIIELMVANDYFVYADTYINTIFVDDRAWAKRSGK